MVYKLYKQYAHPLARVVCGLPISWKLNFATTRHPSPSIQGVQGFAWSSCSKFIAVGLRESTEVLDAVTLERLHNFTHPEFSSETGWLGFSPDDRSLTRIHHRGKGSTTWDLKTGGRISALPSLLSTPSLWAVSSICPMDGNTVAVAEYHRSGHSGSTTISIYNLISGTHADSHNFPERRTVVQIWTRGEFLRFATVEPESITIWEVGSTSEHTLAEIEVLPAPDNTNFGECLFLPTPSRFAFILEEDEDEEDEECEEEDEEEKQEKKVLIWDPRHSKFLLNFVGDQPEGLSFSSDGRFFACNVADQGVHIWKESPTGYVLHRILLSGLMDNNDRPTPFLSPDGESIITSKFNETQLWRTTDPINPPSSVPPRPAEQTEFVLAFSPDKSLIATGRLGGNIATIVDLKSGDPRLIVDTGMKICGLGVTGSTFVAVGEGKIITWKLPAGDRFLNARANVRDSVRTIRFNHPPPPPEWLHSASISPDFNYLVITNGGAEGLKIYNMSTGKYVVGNITEHVFQPRFTRDGRQVRYPAGGLKIIRGRGSDIIGLEPVGHGDHTTEEHLLKSHRGHDLVEYCWILDSNKKRVMWLPHYLRAFGRGDWTWDEQFFALFDAELPEPVVIELYE